MAAREAAIALIIVVRALTSQAQRLVATKPAELATLVGSCGACIQAITAAFVQSREMRRSTTARQ